jgi:hypothetical protein
VKFWNDKVSVKQIVCGLYEKATIGRNGNEKGQAEGTADRKKQLEKKRQ